MNANQLEALRKLRDEGRPVRLHHSTGRSLEEHGLAKKTRHGLFAPTKAGIAEINERERSERQLAIDNAVPSDSYAYQRKVIAWLELHSDLSITGRTYARHVTNALLTGLVPVESGYRWGEEGDAKIRAWVEVAIDSLEKLRAAKALAHEKGGDILVSYIAAGSVEDRAASRRAKAVSESVEEDAENVVGLDAYRQKRLA